MRPSKLATRLRRRKGEEMRPTPVLLFYDSLAMTQEEAIDAAYRSGKIPLNAPVFVLPEQIRDHAVWEQHVRAERARLDQERAEQRNNMQTDKTNSLPVTRRTHP